MAGRTAIIALLVATGGLAFGTSLGTSGVTSWDVVLTYEYEDENLTDYTETGVYDRIITCDGNWTEVKNSLYTASDTSREIRYKISYSELRVRVENQSDGQVEARSFECDGDASTELTSSTATWESHTQCNPAGAAKEDKVTEDEFVAPYGNGWMPSQWTGSIDGLCIKLRAASDTSGVTYAPFTGQVFAHSWTEPGDTDVLRIKSCNMIGGECWYGQWSGSEGPADPNPSTEKWWEGETWWRGPFHAHEPGAGHFGWKIWRDLE